MKNKAIILFFLLFLTSCPLYMDTKVGYEIDNKSNDTLYVYSGLGGVTGGLYPDTTLPEDVGMRLFVPPRRKVSMTYSGSDFEKFFKSHFHNDTAWVAIISLDTIKKYGWEDVRVNHRVLVRYDLSYPDFMHLDLVVPYPATGEMSHMKMWPPYKSK